MVSWGGLSFVQATLPRGESFRGEQPNIYFITAHTHAPHTVFFLPKLEHLPTCFSFDAPSPCSAIFQAW